MNIHQRRRKALADKRKKNRLARVAEEGSLLAKARKVVSRQDTKEESLLEKAKKVVSSRKKAAKKEK